MNLRFSTRGGASEAVVHLTVLETLHFGGIVRRRGEALCRPQSSLPNLEPLPVQTLGARRCCSACIAAMGRIRIRQQVALPPAAGVLAGDLLRGLEAGSRKRGPAPPRPAISFTGGDR
ncbi:MAG: hypothetical protein ISP90_08850 [Nevskia sp.]|nr:hypothetical protein [Nevskia sp.]